jgi:hypothetical protein
VISTIVNNLLDINKKYVLLAPTGRAAKVIALFEQTCFYDSQKIYFPKKSSGGVSLLFAKNKHKIPSL